MRTRTSQPCIALARLVVPLVLMTGAPSFAQGGKDTLSYELVYANISQTPPRQGFIVVEFGESLPTRYLAAGGTTLTSGAEWTIEVRNREDPSQVKTLRVTEVFVATDPAENRLVALRPEATLNPATEQIRIRLLEGNFPDVTIAEPKKQKAVAFYGPAKGKDDADLYFKGLAVATTKTAPAYSIDAKFAYLQPLRGKWGSLGGGATYIVDKASDIGPDTITVTTSYSKVLVFAPATGLVLNVDPIGYELDDANKTRNLRSAARGQLVMPSAKIGAKSYLTADVVLGYEAGWQQKSDGVTADKNIWRTVLGANGYALIQGGPFVKRIDLNASWTVRLLGQDEPLNKFENGAAVSTSNEEVRHLVTASGVFMINKGLGFSVGYRHGSEPPTYKYVRHRGEVGLVLKLKQINKG